MDFRLSKKFSIHAIFTILAAGVVITIVVLLLLHLGRAVGAPFNDSQAYDQTLMAGNLPIPVSIAGTEAAREQGLSDTASLPANNGKLFVFEKPGNYGFWMKDMRYSLDFVWIDANMRIVGITPDVAASSYPKIFHPPVLVQYVLEVNSGFSTQHGLVVGEQLRLKK